MAGNIWNHVNKGNTIDGSLFNNVNSWISNTCGAANWYGFSTGLTADGAA